VAHHGIILLRLQNETPAAKIAALQQLLVQHGERLPGSFVVVTESQVRFART
jgi:hypothetical protein